MPDIGLVARHVGMHRRDILAYRAFRHDGADLGVSVTIGGATQSAGAEVALHVAYRKHEKHAILALVAVQFVIDINRSGRGSSGFRRHVFLFLPFLAVVHPEISINGWHRDLHPPN